MTHDNEDIDIEFPQASPDRLHVHNRRQLSAMLDGELSPDQARFMLRRLQHDAELAACWERWQVCGDVLRGRGHSLLPADFSGRVMAAVGGPAADSTPLRNPVASVARPQHRMLRWGGGALAASMALVALFMARQLPDPQAQGQLEAASAMRAAPALVEGVAVVAGPADAGGNTASAEPSLPATPGPQGGGSVLPALLAAVPAVAVVAEVPRRTGERGSTRSQAQRAALRRSQAGAEEPARRVAVAAAPRPPMAAAVPAPVGVAADTALPALAGTPADADGNPSLFGALPPAATRPWPRAVLPGITRSQPFAAAYGLPQEEAFAPFQPRLQRSQAAPAADVAVGVAVDEATGSTLPETGSIR